MPAAPIASASQEVAPEPEEAHAEAEAVELEGELPGATGAMAQAVPSVLVRQGLGPYKMGPNVQARPCLPNLGFFFIVLSSGAASGAEV
ncbi:unnamed protein product [Durusdinium trenchii]|uniref:Uncharacterized protein n=1 Tax=Durusdinium trenchii TaxID=1381693 RepID=A0ABP0PJV8_9DINO